MTTTVRDHRRGEDPRAVCVRVRGARQSRVVVLPVHRPGARVEGIEGVPAAEDDQGRPKARGGLEPGRGRHEAPVGGGVPGVLSRVGRDGVLRVKLDPPAQLPRRQVHGVEGVVPGAHVHRATDDGRCRRHGVTGREEPCRAQGAGRGLGQGRPAVKGVLGIVAVGTASPRGRCRPTVWPTVSPTTMSAHGRRTALVVPSPAHAATPRTAPPSARRESHDGTGRALDSSPTVGKSAEAGCRPRAVAGPRAGAGFSDGPESGATIFPVGYGQRIWAGTHTVTLVGKSKPPATVAGVDGLPVGEGHPHDPAPVGGWPAAGQQARYRRRGCRRSTGSRRGRRPCRRGCTGRGLAELGDRGARAPSLAPARAAVGWSPRRWRGCRCNCSTAKQSQVGSLPRCRRGRTRPLTNVGHLHLGRAGRPRRDTGRRWSAEDAWTKRSTLLGADVRDQEVVVVGRRPSSPAGPAPRCRRRDGAPPRPRSGRRRCSTSCSSVRTTPPAGRCSGREVALRRGDVVAEDVVPAVDGASGVGLVVVEHAVGRRAASHRRCSGRAACTGPARTASVR